MKHSILFPHAARASWIMLILTWLLWAMNAIDREIMFRLQPAIVNTYHLSPSQWGYMMSAFFLAYALLALPAGIYADRLGRGWRRKISQVWYMVIFTISSALIGIAGLSAHLWQFVLWRLFGLGSAGGAEVTNVAQCAEYWPREHRGFALGLHHTGYPIGALLGGLACAGLLETFGPDKWRYVFLIIPLIGFVLAGLIWTYSNATTYAEVNAFARRHALTAPEDEAEEAPVSLAQQWQDIRAALGNRNVLVTVVCAALINFAQALGLWFLASYTVFVMGKSDAAGAVAGVVPYITGWLGQLVWGAVSDRLGRRWTLVILSLWYATATLLLLWVSGMTSLWLVLLFWGGALNAVFPVYYAMMADHAPKATGSAMGLLLMLVFLGTVPATPIGGLLIEHMGGWNHAQGYILGFAVATGAGVLAALLQALFTRDARVPSAATVTLDKHALG
jgi:MFS family permease